MQSGSAHLSAELLDAAVELMGRSGRGGTVRVRGRSMLPTLVEGQILAVEFNPDRLAHGDMLIFRQAGHLVVHRLLGRARFSDGRATRSLGGRLYARLLAWHDLFWAMASLAAHGLQRGLSRVGIRWPLRSWVAAVDRRLLRQTHRWLFRSAHPSIPAPDEAEGVAPGVEV